jgi:hypothetical protein
MAHQRFVMAKYASRSSMGGIIAHLLVMIDTAAVNLAKISPDIEKAWTCPDAFVGRYNAADLRPEWRYPSSSEALPPTP